MVGEWGTCYNFTGIAGPIDEETQTQKKQQQRRRYGTLPRVELREVGDVERAVEVQRKVRIERARTM